jgi:hypothetical protein
MKFHLRIGDALLLAFALLLVLAVVHTAQVHSHVVTPVRTPVEHPDPSKAAQWPHRVA